MCAGQDVEIALAARDGYGNAVNNLEPDAVKAVATGNEACVKFEPHEVRACHPVLGAQCASLGARLSLTCTA